MYTWFRPDVLQRDSDRAFIPLDPENMDYQHFLEWEAAGNKAAPYVPVEVVRDWPAEIAALRYVHETGGTVVGGLPLPTDRESVALITGATVQTLFDPAYSLNFKTAAGFFTLDAQQIVAMATAVRAHVQACFDREAELLTALEAGTFTEAMLEEGWPPAG